MHHGEGRASLPAGAPGANETFMEFRQLALLTGQNPKDTSSLTLNLPCHCPDVTTTRRVYYIQTYCTSRIHTGYVALENKINFSKADLGHCGVFSVRTVLCAEWLLRARDTMLLIICHLSIPRTCPGTQGVMNLNLNDLDFANRL